MSERKKIMLIYTGGTIGMVQDPVDGKLQAFGFDRLLDNIPELNQFDVDIQTAQLSQIIDSSNMSPELWSELAELIMQSYNECDGFVILHGTDTLAYTASALSFMIQGLNKPVILTGSQLPIGMIRTDGKENLITAIEVAASSQLGLASISEVAVYFEYRLMRGNRVTKYSAEHFDAFHSPNYPALADAGIEIAYNHPYLRQPEPGTPLLLSEVNNSVSVLKLFPGISEASLKAVLSGESQGIIMESFGAGNGPTAPWFLDSLRNAVKEGKTILNITQCLAGTVSHGRYKTSAAFEEIGIISGGDMTFEAGLCKLMHAMAQFDQAEDLKAYLETPICGEKD